MDADTAVWTSCSLLCNVFPLTFLKQALLNAQWHGLNWLARSHRLLHWESVPFTDTQQMTILCIWISIYRHAKRFANSAVQIWKRKGCFTEWGNEMYSTILRSCMFLGGSTVCSEGHFPVRRFGSDRRGRGVGKVLRYAIYDHENITENQRMT